MKRVAASTIVLFALVTIVLPPRSSQAQEDANAVGKAMNDCVIGQASALENKDIEKYMSFFHPGAPNLNIIKERVLTGMKLGPKYSISATPTSLGNMNMQVDLSFSRLSGERIVTTRRAIRVDFSAYNGTVMIWQKTTPCTNPVCKKGVVSGRERKVAGTDPATGRQFYFDKPTKSHCPVCLGKTQLTWLDVP